MKRLVALLLALALSLNGRGKHRLNSTFCSSAISGTGCKAAHHGVLAKTGAAGTVG